MSPDLINGLFELFGGMLILINIRQVLKDRKVHGVHWLPLSFFTAWGFWNLFYYSNLSQFYSLLGGLVMVVLNTVWLALLVYFKKFPDVELN